MFDEPASKGFIVYIALKKSTVKFQISTTSGVAGLWFSRRIIGGKGEWGEGKLY